MIPDQHSPEALRTEGRAMDETTTNTEKTNHAAVFHPMTTPDERPAIEIAGVFVFAYLAVDGTLQVTVDTVTRDDRPEWRYGVRMRLNVNGGTVFEGTDEYGEYDREIIRHNTDDVPAVIVQTGQPIHVFGDVNVITGPHGAAEKLAELPETELAQ